MVNAATNLVRKVRTMLRRTETFRPNENGDPRQEVLKSVVIFNAIVPLEAVDITTFNNTRLVPALHSETVVDVINHTQQEIPRFQQLLATQTLPQIVVSNRELREISYDCIRALMRLHQNPIVYVQDNRLIRIIRTYGNRPIIEQLDDDSLPGILDRVGDFIKLIPVKAGDDSADPYVIEKPSKVPTEVVKDILHNLRLCMNGVQNCTLPFLDYVIENPIYTESGELIATEGYYPQYRLYYARSEGFTMEPLPETITIDDISAAINLIHEATIDFPYVKGEAGTIAENASRDNITALILTGLLRPIIDGAIPCHITTKPESRTGAGLLADTVSLILNGRIAPKATQPEDEAEWRKSILSQLTDGSNLWIIDNVVKTIDSEAFNALLTSRTISGRVLGRIKTTTLRNNVVVMLNGNNVSIANDGGGRSYLTQINAHCDRPGERVGFKHDQIPYITQNRAALVRAFLILTKFWVMKGRPLPEANINGNQTRLISIGGFEEWRRIVGGIMYCAELYGIMGNYSTVIKELDREKPQWAGFFYAWFAKWGEREITVSELASLIDLAKEKSSTDPEYNASDIIIDNLPDEFADDVRRGRTNISIKVGMLLRGRVNKHYTINDEKTGEPLYDIELQVAGETRTNSRKWKVVCKNIKTDKYMSGKEGCVTEKIV